MQQLHMINNKRSASAVRNIVSPSRQMRRVSSNGVIDASAASRTLDTVISAVESVSGEHSLTDVSCSKMGWVPSDSTKSITEIQPDSHSIRHCFHDLDGTRTYLTPQQEMEMIHSVHRRGLIHPSVIDRVVISDTIVTVAPLKANLCLFSAMYNSLRTPELRDAFSAGNPCYPTLSFLAFFHRTGDFVEKFTRGYNSKDIDDYLYFLKSNHHISTYCWKRLHYGGHRRPWSILFSSFLIPSARMSGQAYVLFGSSPTGLTKNHARKKFQHLHHVTDQILYYLSLTASCTHATVVQIDSVDHCAYIYDSGRRVRRPFSILELSLTICSVNTVYLFSFTL